MTTLPPAVPLRGAAWLAVQPVTASATVITATNQSAIFIGFSLWEKYRCQFLTTGESPANCGPVQRAVREARAALQLQIMAPSWRLSHSGLAWQLCDFCISLQSPDPTQAHLRPSGVSKQSNVAQAIEQASNNAATTPNMRRADRISPPMSRGGILP